MLEYRSFLGLQVVNIASYTRLLEFNGQNKKPYGSIDGPFITQDTQSKKSEYTESA